MIDKKHQYIVNNLESEDLMKYIIASISVISDVILVGKPFAECSDVMAQLQPFFDSMERGIIALIETVLPDQIFYQLQFIRFPLQRNYITAILGASVFKTFRKADYLALATQYANQLVCPQQNLFLRRYIYTSLIKIKLKYDNDKSKQAVHKQVIPIIQSNFRCAITAYRYILAENARETQDYAEFVVKLLIGCENEVFGFLMTEITGITCPVLQFQVFKFMCSAAIDQITAVFADFSRIAVLVLQQEKVQFRVREALQTVFGRISQELGASRLNDAVAVFLDILLNAPLDVVFDTLLDIVQSPPAAQLVISRFEQLFSTTKTTTEFQLASAFIQKMFQMSDATQDLDQIKFCYQFLIQKDVAGTSRLLSAIISDVYKKELVLTFKQVADIIQMLVTVTVKSTTLFEVAALVSSCEYVKLDSFDDLVSSVLNLITQGTKQSISDLAFSIVNLLLKQDVNILQIFNQLKVLLSPAHTLELSICVFEQNQDIEILSKMYYDISEKQQYLKRISKCCNIEQVKPIVLLHLQTIRQVDVQAELVSLFIESSSIKKRKKQLKSNGEYNQNVLELLSKCKILTERVKDNPDEIDVLLEVAWIICKYNDIADPVFLHDIEKRAQKLLQKCTDNDQRRFCYYWMAEIGKQ